MAYIRSANQANFPALEGPSGKVYRHGADSRNGYIPMAFQICSPYDWKKCLLPHALVLHVNPQSLSESHNHKIERIETMGGFVEQHWPEDLTELSADGTTGAFVNLYTGLSSVNRQRTIAYDRFKDLYNLYRNGGALYAPNGSIVLQGKIVLMYDRGTYIGEFTQFSVEESAMTPFSFTISWSFKVEETLLTIPNPLRGIASRLPEIQGQNVTQTRTEAQPVLVNGAPTTPVQNIA
jgi:hypothetical protein